MLGLRHFLDPPTSEVGPIDSPSGIQGNIINVFADLSLIFSATNLSGVSGASSLRDLNARILKACNKGTEQLNDNHKFADDSGIDNVGFLHKDDSMSLPSFESG